MTVIKLVAAAVACMVGGAVAQTSPVSAGQALLKPALSSAVCLTAASNTNGAIVTVQDCTGEDAQKWLFDGVADGAVGAAVKVFGDKCLDVRRGDVGGRELQIWTCNGGDNQQWNYNNVSSKVVWSSKKQCLDLTSGITAPGNRVQIWECTDSNINQVWWKTG